VESFHDEVVAGRDQENAVRWRDEKLHLSRVFGVVHEEQDAFAMQHAEIQRTEFVFFFGELGFGMEGAEDVGHGLRGGEGFFADAFEIERDLRVGIVRREFGSEFEGEGGLANSALALESGDVDAAFFDGDAEFGEFGGASGEVGGRGWELVR
jgi:hypothetical protein